MIHLELTNDLTTEEMLMALRRMVARRGVPKTILTDNAKYFVKGAKKIQEAQLREFATERKIDWNFICPRAPHRGAYWERLNRSLKEPLRKVLGRSLLSFTEIYTILAEIESVLNQRPLTYQGSDPKNILPITPAHLGIGRPLGILPQTGTGKEVSTSRRYRYVQEVLGHFWQRWAKEYVPTLATRKKWHQSQEAPKIGDVCLISEDGLARPKWEMGRVVERITSRDGLVRTLRLKTKTGEVLRPIQKLILILILIYFATRTCHTWHKFIVKIEVSYLRINIDDIAWLHLHTTYIGNLGLHSREIRRCYKYRSG